MQYMYIIFPDNLFKRTLFSSIGGYQPTVQRPVRAYFGTLSHELRMGQKTKKVSLRSFRGALPPYNRRRRFFF